MPNYRRRHHEWGCYFLTVVTNKRHPLFRDPHARELLKKAIQDTLATQPMTIHEMVLLPDHLHILCSLPEPKQDYSTRIRLIKKRFTRAWLAVGGREKTVSTSRQARGERGIWQRRFYEYTVKSQADYRSHVVYMHMNPVKHGLADCPLDWPWSTFHRHVQQGTLPHDWRGPIDLPGAGEYDQEIVP